MMEKKESFNNYLLYMDVKAKFVLTQIAKKKSLKLLSQIEHLFIVVAVKNNKVDQHYLEIYTILKNA